MMLATDLAVLDHADGSVLLIANAINYDDTDERVDWAHEDAVERLDRMTAELAGAGRRRGRHVSRSAEPAYDRGRTSDDYRAAVERAKEEIRAGEAFQVVVSQRFSMRDRRRPARRLPDAAGHQPQPVHVPAPLRRLRRRRLQPGGPGQGQPTGGR